MVETTKEIEGAKNRDENRRKVSKQPNGNRNTPAKDKEGKQDAKSRHPQPPNASTRYPAPATKSVADKPRGPRSPSTSPCAAKSRLRSFPQATHSPRRSSTCGSRGGYLLARSTLQRSAPCTASVSGSELVHRSTGCCRRGWCAIDGDVVRDDDAVDDASAGEGEGNGKSGW